MNIIYINSCDNMKKMKIRTIQIKVIDPVYKELKKRKGKRSWDDFILDATEDK